MRRLERVLNANQLTRGRWSREHGYIYRLGQARLFFLSGQPGANIVGATANLLLEVDEAQDILIERYDKDIAPMAAPANATRVFWGTAWTPDTLLGRERRLASTAQLQDGIQRVFSITPSSVPNSSLKNSPTPPVCFPQLAAPSCRAAICLMPPPSQTTSTPSSST